MTVCIGCGCDEQHACVDRDGRGCRWVEISPSGAAGICSECEDLYPPSCRTDELLAAEPELADELDAEAEACGLVDDGDDGTLILPGHPGFDWRLERRR